MLSAQFFRLELCLRRVSRDLALVAVASIGKRARATGKIATDFNKKE
jgi:hypothetical protein